MAKKIDNYRMTLALHEATNEGIALGRHENQVVFVAGGVPGDVVEVEVFRKKKNYLEARLLSIVEPSVNRETPFCKHFGVCGGCKWQNMNYETQLLYKQKQVLCGQNFKKTLSNFDIYFFSVMLPLKAYMIESKNTIATATNPNITANASKDFCTVCKIN